MTGLQTAGFSTPQPTGLQFGFKEKLEVRENVYKNHEQSSPIRKRNVKQAAVREL